MNEEDERNARVEQIEQAIMKAIPQGDVVEILMALTNVTSFFLSTGWKSDENEENRVDDPNA